MNIKTIIKCLKILLFFNNLLNNLIYKVYFKKKYIQLNMYCVQQSENGNISSSLWWKKYIFKSFRVFGSHESFKVPRKMSLSKLGLSTMYYSLQAPCVAKSRLTTTLLSRAQQLFVLWQWIIISAEEGYCTVSTDYTFIKNM